MATYLLVLGERQAIYWVLSNRRMAFTQNRQSLARRLEPGDSLVLYSSRSAWHNPTRDRGRLIGIARVAGSPRTLRRPMTLAGRDFTMEVDITFEGVTPYPRGVELATLVPDMDTFPSKVYWSTRLRTPLLEIAPADVALLTATLSPLMLPVEDVLSGYKAAARLE